MHSGSADRLALAQRILNSHGVPPGHHRDVDRPIPVRVRLEWERDGVQVIETMAVEWTSHLVRVWMNDRRWMLGAVWVGAEDVRRV